MRVFHGFENLPSFRAPAATVGSYDGVHSGHRVLLDRIRREAAAVGGESIVLTFDPHPRVTLGTQERLRLLTSLEEKIYLLDQFGIDNLIVIPFDRAFSRIPSESFVKDYLIGKVGVKNLVVGFNHRFGHDKEGDYRLLNGLHDEFGFRVTEIEKQDVDAEKVSSTVIRRLIERGEMRKAARMLSHPYLLAGDVDCAGHIASGEALKLLPPPGEYPVRIEGRPGVLRITAKGTPELLRTAGKMPSGHILIEF